MYLFKNSTNKQYVGVNSRSVSQCGKPCPGGHKNSIVGRRIPRSTGPGRLKVFHNDLLALAAKPVSVTRV